MTLSTEDQPAHSGQMPAQSACDGGSQHVQRGGTVVLAGVCYTVESVDVPFLHLRLRGPSRWLYHLRRKLGDDTGRCEVISVTSGYPLLHQGDPVQAVHIGDVIEQYIPPLNNH